MLLKSKNIAYLGVLLAINQLFIILSSIVKTNTLLLFGGAALVIGIVIVEYGIKSGIVFYIASILLGFILTTDKVEFLTYILFFGLYSVAKYFIEKFVPYYKNAWITEMLIKIVFFNLIAVLAYFISRGFITIKLYWWMIVAAELIFIIYDYAFTIFVNYYINNIKPKINIKRN